MKKTLGLYALVALCTAMMSVGCTQKAGTSPGCDNSEKIEYRVDYTVHFAAEHDSTMQLSASSNIGNVKVAQVESENLIGEYGKPVTNTFIMLEGSAPAGKSITLQQGGLSYTGGQPEYIYNNTIGSDDMVELRVLDTNALTHSHTNALTHSSTLYSIRDNMFYDPYDAQSFTIPAGHRFLVVLPVMTEELYPRNAESHGISIVFDINAE